MDTIGFWKWVNQARAAKGLPYRAIERAAGLSNGAISKRESDGLDPTLETLQAITTAFDLPMEMVFERAGLLNQPNLQEAQNLLVQLCEDDQRNILAQIRALLELRRSR